MKLNHHLISYCKETLYNLRGIRERYENFHGVKITDSALEEAVELASRYISDRFLPDKAVDLVDEAAAKIRMEMNSAPLEIDNSRRRLIQFNTSYS